MKDLRFISNDELSNEQLKNIVHTVNTLADDHIITSSESQITAEHYTLNDSSHAYVFNFNRRINSDEADNIIGGLYSTFEFDFVVEIEADIENPETEENKQFSQDSIVVEHNKWFMDNMKEGWSFGTRYDENTKKNPFLRPYHKLSKRQKKIMEQSKEKLGYYGLDESFITEMRLREDKEKVRKKERSKAIRVDNDVMVEYNEHHNAYCVMGDQSGFCYAHDINKAKAEQKKTKIQESMKNAQSKFKIKQKKQIKK
ncbi:hypothetical protein PBI_SCTP2_282 [Salicola phage SCTP-2]|nr:hypothetical protein PBI_SCTP2_282 [Salicola phage SCTP-2]